MDVKQLSREILALSHEEKRKLMELLMPKLQPEMLADRDFVTGMMPRCFELMRRINPDLVARMRAMMEQEEDLATVRPDTGRWEDIRHPE